MRRRIFVRLQQGLSNGSLIQGRKRELGYPVRTPSSASPVRPTRQQQQSRTSSTTSTGETGRKAIEEAAQGEVTKTLEWMSEKIQMEGASEFSKKLHPTVRQSLRLQSRPLEPMVISEPPRSELQKIILAQAIPFVGFGIMDNAILIIAGDAIDTSLGVLLGISTMCAAALGNIISDVAGIALGTIIEDFTTKLGLPAPNISAAQRQLRSVRYAGQLGNCIGIVIGCLIGMFPLMFIDQNKIQKLKQETHLNEVFDDFVKEAKQLVGAQVCNLYVIVDDESSKKPSMIKSSDDSDKQQYFYSKYKDGVLKEVRIPVGKGITSRAALTGTAINVADVKQNEDYLPDLWQSLLPNDQIRNMACVPVFDSRGKVVAIVQAINKVGRGKLARRNTVETMPQFTATDMQILKVLASHVGVALQSVYQEENEMSLKGTIRILKEQGLAGLSSSQRPTNATLRETIAVPRSS